MGDHIFFTNARLCKGGELVNLPLAFCKDTGQIVATSRFEGLHSIDLGGAIVAPGFVEVQTNGLRGFHFTHFENEDGYKQKLDDVARYLPRTGVTGFLPTIPTVASSEFKKVSSLNSSLYSFLTHSR